MKDIGIFNSLNIFVVIKTYVYIYINNITQFYRFDLEFFFREYFQEIYNEAVIDSFEIFKNSRLQSYFA